MSGLPAAGVAAGMGRVRVGTASWTDRTLIALFNNCYRDYAQANAQQLAALLQA